MGLFADDERQDQRLEALERHVRELTDTVQSNRAELAETRIVVLALQAAVDEKVSASDVDPTIVKLNEELADARQQIKQSSAAASEGWAALQAGVNDAFETLNKSVRNAYDKLKDV